MRVRVRTQVKELEKLNTLTEQQKADICASFQYTVGESILDRTKNALTLATGTKYFVLAGGVAANQYIRGKLEHLCEERSITFVAPPIHLCTDNAAMIAWAGLERFRLGMVDGLDFEPRARWPLTSL